MENIGIKTKIMPESITIAAVDMASETKALEEKLAGYVGAQHCVLVNSGTAGLLMALKAAGVQGGDYVMCTSFSFFATVEIILLSGAVPLLVDTNPETFNIDPYCLEHALKKRRDSRRSMPKALIATDSFGMPCDFDSIEEICGRYNITLIEDMSCSFGASYKSRKAGAFGRFSVASFFPARPLGGAGDGGGVFCRDVEDSKLLRSYRSASKKQSFDFVLANIVCEKLSGYDADLANRQLVAARYRDNMRGFVNMQQAGEDYISAYTQFVIETDSQSQREYVMDALSKRQIPCCVMHAGQKGCDVEEGRDIPENTRQSSQKLLAIPIHPYLSIHVVDYISECIMEAVETSRK